MNFILLLTEICQVTNWMGQFQTRSVKILQDYTFSGLIIFLFIFHNWYYPNGGNIVCVISGKWTRLRFFFCTNSNSELMVLDNFSYTSDGDICNNRTSSSRSTNRSTTILAISIVTPVLAVAILLAFLLWRAKGKHNGV